jgi:hypothetical protein
MVERHRRRERAGHTKKETLRESHDTFSLDPNSRYLKWKSG